MEIQSEDLSLAEPEPPPKQTEKPVLELALEDPPRRAAPAPQPAPAMRGAPVETDYSPPSETVERKQAQQLFEAKDWTSIRANRSISRWARWACLPWARSAISGINCSPDA